MKKLLLLALIPLSVLALFYGYKQFNPSQPSAEIHGIYLSTPQVITPFALTQTNGTPFTDQNLVGQWSLVFFGFTYCPDICPTTLALLNQVTQDLAQHNPDQPTPHVVFISIDPERDNLAQLDKYTHYFNPNFVAVTGEISQLKTVARQFGVVFDKVSLDPAQPDQYLMEHSTSIALVNPNGAIEAIFTSPHDAESLVQDIAKVIKP
jgi:protein SCO1/2